MYILTYDSEYHINDTTFINYSYFEKDIPNIRQKGYMFL